MEFEDFVFKFEDDSLGESWADSGSCGKGFGVLGDDCFNGASFGEGADEGEGDFCSAALDFSEHFEKATLAGVAESKKCVIGFTDDEAGIEIDSFADDGVLDEDGVRNVDFVSDAVAIDDDG